MVQVIRSCNPDSDRPAPFRFKVYLSPRDGETVLGYLEPYCVIHGQQATWFRTDFGVPVADAFERVLDLARHAGMQMLWIDDPGGLFPNPEPLDRAG